MFSYRALIGATIKPLNKKTNNRPGPRNDSLIIRNVAYADDGVYLIIVHLTYDIICYLYAILYKEVRAREGLAILSGFLALLS